MIEILNANQGLISAIGLVISIVIAIIGFFINSNISKIVQKQKIGDHSKGLQAGNNATDRSQNIGSNSSSNTQTNE